MAERDEHPDLLAIGLYTVPEAAALLDFDAAALRRWTTRGRGRSAPVIEGGIGKVAQKSAITFTELMELRLLTAFYKAGVPLREIRAIVIEARRLLEHPHPFATKTVFRTDGKKIIAEIAKGQGVDMYDLRSRNFEMSEVISPSLKKDFKFDPEGNISAWYPRRKTSPHVIVHPKYSFGAPTLEQSKIPTSTLADSFIAEGDAQIVADLFDVSADQVREAVSFEASLGHAA